MKKILYIALSLLLTLGITGCNDWLDVNVDPDNPNNASATVESRLPYSTLLYVLMGLSLYAWFYHCRFDEPNVHYFFKRKTFGLESHPELLYYLISKLVYWSCL